MIYTLQRLARAALALLAMSVLGVAAAQLQAQDGWGLPRAFGQSSATDGLALDAGADLAYVATEAGIEARPLDGSPGRLVVAQRGVRELSGASGPGGVALAWVRRSVYEDEGLWASWRGQTRRLLDAPPLDFALAHASEGPLVAYAVPEGEGAALVLRPWGEAARIVYRTQRSIAALAVRRTEDGRVHLLFSDGFRQGSTLNAPASRDRFEAVLLSGPLAGPLEGGRIGSAAFSPGQHFLVAARGSEPVPLWWSADDRARSGRQLVARVGGRVVPLGQPSRVIGGGRLVGQVGEEVFWTDGDRVFAATLPGLEPRRPLLAPDVITAVAVSEANGVRTLAWQSAVSDGFSSDLYIADTRLPYQPTLVDRAAVALGWNPWHPGDSLVGQLAVSLLAGVLAAFPAAALGWALSGAGRRAVGVGVAVGWGLALLARLAGDWLAARPEAAGWVFEPLLTPPWAVVLVGLLLGTLLARPVARRAASTELGPALAAATVVFVAAAAAAFARLGFIQY